MSAPALAGAHPWRDLPGDPGLEPTASLDGPGPWVGTPASRPLERFATDPELDALLLRLQEAFGPQRWWPARTPFEVIVGAVLTQGVAWRNAELALASLASAAGSLSPGGLLALEPAALAEAIRPAGAYNVKAARLLAVCRWYLESGGLERLRAAPLGALRADLLRVHGVGPETADAILCHAAGRRTVVADAYVRRVLERHGFVPSPVPYERARAWAMERLVPESAVFEEFHALCVRVGYDHCKPSPRCSACPAPTPEGLVDAEA